MEDKKNYQQTMEDRLGQIGAKIDELQARTQQAGADTRIKLEEQIETSKPSEMQLVCKMPGKISIVL